VPPQGMAASHLPPAASAARVRWQHPWTQTCRGYRCCRCIGVVHRGSAQSIVQCRSV
jgi:hypothetical protein